MKIFIFDRDDTLTFDNRGRDQLINPDALLPILETIDANPQMLWAIASASAMGVNEDEAWKLIRRAVPQMSQPIYAPVKRNIDGLSSRIHSITYRNFVNVDNKPLEATEVTPATDLNATAVEAILQGTAIAEDADTMTLKLEKGTTREPFSFDFTFHKKDKVVFQLGRTQVTMSVGALRDSNAILSAGDYKLFSILNTLDSAKLTLDINQAEKLRELGVINITAPSYYTKIASNDVVFCDDKYGCYNLAQTCGFQAILANSRHASYLKEGGASQIAPDNSYLDKLNNNLHSIISGKPFSKLNQLLADFQSLVIRGDIYKRGNAIPWGAVTKTLNQQVDVNGQAYYISSRNFGFMAALMQLREAEISFEKVGKLIAIVDDIQKQEGKATPAQRTYYESVRSYLEELSLRVQHTVIHRSSSYHDIITDLKNVMQVAGPVSTGPHYQRALADCLVSEKFHHDFSKLVAKAAAHDKPNSAEEEQASFIKHSCVALTKLSVDIESLFAEPYCLQQLCQSSTFRRLAFTMMTADAQPLVVSTPSSALGAIGAQRMLISSSVATTPAAPKALTQLMSLVELYEQDKITDAAGLQGYLNNKAPNLRSLLSYALPALRGADDLNRVVNCKPLVDALANEYASKVRELTSPTALYLQAQEALVRQASSSTPSSSVDYSSSSSSSESLSASPGTDHDSRFHH